MQGALNNVDTRRLSIALGLAALIVVAVLPQLRHAAHPASLVSSPISPCGRKTMMITR